MPDPKKSRPPSTPAPAPPAAPSAGPRRATRRAARRARVTARTGIDTFTLKSKLETQRRAAVKAMLANLSEWKISVARRSGKINPELWDIRSKADLDRVKKEWSYLGITKGNSAFYNEIFKQLSKAHDRQFLGQITKPSAKYDSYTKPFDNMKDLDTNTDPDFALAVRFFASIKKMVADQDTFQKATKEGLQTRNEDGIISEGGRIIRENLSAFKEAIKARDYSTAAVYIIGMVALYKTYKSLPKDKQDRYSKYLWWGAAGYCGHIFLKKSGIDILKKLGFKDEDAEVRGTPMAALARLNLEGLHKEDYITARDVNFVNFSDLYAKYQETNKAGIRWVDPNQFPNAFGDRFKGMRPGDIAKGRKLSAKQKAYKAKGESLYRVVQALEQSYNMTMRPNTKNHPSLAAVLSTGILTKSTVFDFVVALQRYAPEHRVEKGIIASLKGVEKAKDRLREVFKGSGLGFNLEKGRKAGHFDGQLMGFPVVYVRDSRKKRFLVFARSDYDRANKAPHVGAALGEIPFTGDASASVTALRKAIHSKVMDRDTGLLSRFVRNSKGLATFTNVRYDHAHGGWMAEVSYKRGKIIKGTGPIPMKVNIVIGDNGRSISLTRRTGGQLVYIKDVLDANAFYGNLALSQLVTQRATGGATDFSALQWFHLNGRLDFDDDDPSDDKFRVKIRNVPMAIWIRLNPKSKQYEFVDKDMEAKLLKSGLFKRELREAVGNNKELQGSVDDLRAMIASTPESYFIHLVKNVPSWFSKATWYKWFRGVQLSHFTGSVAKLYTYAMIEAQREKILTDFEISLSGAKKLSDIGKYVNKTLPAAINDFKQLTRKLSKIRDRHTAEGSTFDADEYSETILTDLMAIGCKSNDYKEWYRRFSASLLVGNTPDDIRRNKSAKIKQLMKVFAYYTAPIDDPSIDGANLYAKKPKKPAATATAAEKAKYKKDLKEWEKAQKYRQYAAYAQYVAEQIYLKMKIPRTTVYPAPSNSWWDIKPFGPQFVASYISSHELVDSRPTWRLNKDYIGFDVYVKKLKKGEPVDENLVILPRNIKTVTVTMPTDPAKKAKAEAVLRKIMGGPVPTFDKIRKTDMEIQFYNLLQKAVMRLQSKYGSRVKAGSFQKFLASYRLAYQVDSKVSSTGAETYTFKMGHEIVPGQPRILFRRGSNMLGQMATLDTFLSNSGTTMTRTVQENQLKAAVARVIQRKILNRGTFKTYFTGKGPLRWLQGVWIDFKDWLWGLRNK